MSRVTRIPALLAGTALVLLCRTAFADPQIGGVTQREFKGATGTPVGATEQYLYFNHDVFAGETVNTPGSGSTKIKFLDNTDIVVGANSTIVLDRFVYDPSSHTGDVAIKFSKGIFRFVSGEITNKDAVKLTTPTASLTIRGTDFKVIVAADGSTILKVDEGAVDTAPCHNGKVVRTDAGAAIKVKPDCTVTTVTLSSVPNDPATDGGADNGNNHSAPPGSPPGPPKGGNGGGETSGHVPK